MKKYSVKQVIKKQKRFDKMDFSYRDEDEELIFPALLSFAVGGSAGVTHLEQLINNGWTMQSGDYFAIVLWAVAAAYGIGEFLRIMWNSFKDDVLFDKMSNKLRAIYQNQGKVFEAEVQKAMAEGRSR